MICRMNLFSNLIQKTWIVFNDSIVRCYRCSASKYSNNLKNTEMRILNVAEKNDAAKGISGILSRGTARRREGDSPYNKIYEFECSVNRQNQKMVMTSVSGHLLTFEFVAGFRSWTKCLPVELFEAPVVKTCPEQSVKIKTTLEREARLARMLIIWTDCDREGENIGFEIITVCRAVNPNLQIYRFQTLRLQKVFPQQLSDCLISYGSCQFPTLGFIVERYNAVNSFVPEPFWKIQVEHTIDELTVSFSWKRVRIFDEHICRVLHEKCLEKPKATVVTVTSKPKSKWRPIPLDTVELEKVASRKLGLNAKEALKIAEKLYTQGYISYPRTETTIFPKEMNLSNLVQLQTADPNWGEFASQVLADGPNPRQGKKTDEAHPPIHPIKHASLGGNEQKVYEYVVRHFLACLSKDAMGHETIVEIDINEERFVANGLLILERNYLLVFPYEKWNSKEIHEYRQGDRFDPTNISLVDGETSPPNLLTEADLISLMEKHGIGTDATHAEHIETIKARLYAGMSDQKYFIPGQLGMGLVEGYDNMGFAMSKPHLRSNLEADLKDICDGRKEPSEVLRSQIEKYKEVFVQAQAQVRKIDEALGKYLESNPLPYEDTQQRSAVSRPILKCPNCGNGMVIRQRANGGSFFVSCVGYPACRNAIWLPSLVINCQPAAETCSTCGNDVRKIEFTFRRGALAPYYPNNYVGCIGGCDDHFLQLLNVDPVGRGGGPSQPPPPAPAPANNRNQNQGFGRNNYDDDDDDDDGWGGGGGGGYGGRRGGGGGGFGGGRGGGGGFGGRGGGGFGRSNGGREVDNYGNSARSNYNAGEERSGFRRGGGGGYSQGFNNRPTFKAPDPPSRRPPPGDDSPDDLVCNCGTPAKKFVVRKENANKGREFYKCQLMTPEGCNFFMWADSQAPPPQPPSRPPLKRGFSDSKDRPSYAGRGSKSFKSDGGSSQSGGPRKCGICHQTGHNRRNCPNT
ncbi:hypothetical protein LSTR_LSTR009737 [Laodelphax striatellus]|uniref:DNA topoisomerase n=1 Tax=Laodelphax striatellus TaxID=195883 RepID=A0A482WVN2_LAOST|nr:hypothetical protein LSTR_LSTR009737 [Laodelphax striatellus]